MISIIDIIQGKFIQEFSAISMGDVVVSITLSFLLSLFIVFIYRSTYAGVNFSSSFAGCLMMISMVTTLVILVISSNVVLSLGMVGALSIVRFRTAVKEATDTAFLFWAIATGILCGAGYVTISILATLLLGLLFVVIHVLGKKHKYGSYMIVARYEADSEVEDKIMALPGFTMKNKSMTHDLTELVGEVRLKDNNPRSINALRSIPGVREISLMVSASGTTL
jgi:uncharacterized membrane protein YhiD involved in acid resistance